VVDLCLEFFPRPKEWRESFDGLLVGDDDDDG
jgi:hypothetical protein